MYFDQTRELDTNVTLRRALAPEGDSVIYQDRVIHVASWAAKFLFTGEQLNQPVERLSGGERARVLIAQLMLQPADVLLLDEPTNDLDIPTLEILEESLLEFRGSLVLVTHDRYMLDRVSTIVLGLDGQGGAESFADYSQWEAWQAERKQSVNEPVPSTRGAQSAVEPPAQARRSSPTSKHVNMPASSNASPRLSNWHRANAPRWKTPRLPATDPGWWQRKRRWKRHRTISIISTPAGRNWKRRRAVYRRVDEGFLR